MIHCTKMLTLEKGGRIAVNYLNFHLGKLAEEDQIKPKESWKEEIKIGVEINKIKNKKGIRKLNETERSIKLINLQN